MSSEPPAGLASHVEFVGGYTPAELPELLSGADVYESSSLSDGTSSSLLEPMSTGLFPVVSDIPAKRPWVTHGRNGLLFEPGDHTALADRLGQALQDGALRAAAARRNRRIILEKGDQETQMDKVLAAMQERFGASGPRADRWNVGLGTRRGSEPGSPRR